MITLYDLGPTKIPKNMGASPYVRRIIFTLNYKKLPFTLVPLNFDLVEPTAKSLGAAPTTTHPDGSPKYTVPFIHDSKTGKAISDSQVIAEYLDSTYPDTPQVISDGTGTLQSVFIDTVTKKAMGIFPVLLPKFDEVSTDEMREARKKQKFAAASPPVVKLTAEQAKETWEKVRKEFEALESAYPKDQVFVMGHKPVFSDLCIAAIGTIARVLFGEGSEEDKEMKSWIGGRVGRVVEEVLKYEKV